MTKMNIQTLTFVTILLFTSCGKSEQEVKREKEEIVKQKTEQLKVINEKAILELSHKYSSISGWDTLQCYTYIYQEMFIDQGKLVSFEGELKDIVKSDSTYYLKVYNTGWHYRQHYIAQISISPEKFLNFQKVLQSKNHNNEGCFVFKVSRIISALPVITSDLDFDGEDSYSYLDYEFDENLLFFNGNLIDFYLNEIIEKDDE